MLAEVLHRLHLIVGLRLGILVVGLDDNVLEAEHLALAILDGVCGAKLPRPECVGEEVGLAIGVREGGPGHEWSIW